MAKKNNVPVWLTVVLIVLLAYSIVDNVIGLVTLLSADVPMELISMITLNICAAVCAVVYCLMGSGKKAAELFHFFCVMYMLSFLFTCILRSMDGNQLYPLPALISFGLTLTYTLGENFGKRKSYFIAIVIFVCAVADFITALVVPCTSATIFHQVGQIVLAATFGIQLIAKYLDKAARGTN